MRFIKYHGLGNDFILVLGGLDGVPTPSRSEVIALCDRRRGIGADGVMLARASESAPVRMELINSDGSVPEMCGNGLRCFVKYAVEELGISGDPLPVETNAGVLRCTYTSDAGGKVTHVRVDMGAPSFRRGTVPMAGPAEDEAVAIEVPCDGQVFIATGVNIGNPHMVLFGDAERATAERWGPVLTAHPWWPEGANVEFARVEAPDRIDVTVWERGCGLTDACGTGATAVAAAAVRLGHSPAETPIAVNLPGGTLEITVGAGFARAWMSGPAAEVYRGYASAGLG